ncbi:MAG TPA: hypothetical protein VG867_03360 [Rhizomicrobium sp.]|nr:hypothetical protein [Rhizomicrobium sp.]
MFAITDIWTTIQSIVHSADVVTLIMMAVVAIGAGFLMQEMGSIISTTVLALIVFAIVKFIYAIALQHADASALMTADLKAFETMQMLLVVSYAIIFGVVIAIVSTVRNLVFG